MQKIGEGSGKYHYDRFCVAVEDRENESAAELTKFAFDSFETLFNQNNLAVVLKTDEKSRGGQAYQFTIKGALDFHSDWIAMQMDASGAPSFHGTTLAATAYPFPPDKLNVLALILPFSYLQLKAMERLFLHLNGQHFLSGRRSWTVRKSHGATLFETCALERFANFVMAGMGGFETFEDDTVNIWAQLMQNFAASRGGPRDVTDQIPDRMQAHTRFPLVYYSRKKADTLDDVRKDPFFQENLTNHPGLGTMP